MGISKQTKCIDGERRQGRSDDPESALSRQLAAIARGFDVDVVLVADLDGTPVASAGEVTAATALASFASGVAKETPGHRSLVTSQGYVVVDVVQVHLRAFVVATFARFQVPDPIAVARAAAGVARILRDGLSVTGEAAMPLVTRGGWGEWPAL